MSPVKHMLYVQSTHHHQNRANLERTQTNARGWGGICWFKVGEQGIEAAKKEGCWQEGGYAMVAAA